MHRYVPQLLRRREEPKSDVHARLDHLEAIVSRMAVQMDHLVLPGEFPTRDPSVIET